MARVVLRILLRVLLGQLICALEELPILFQLEVLVAILAEDEKGALRIICLLVVRVE